MRIKNLSNWLVVTMLLLIVACKPDQKENNGEGKSTTKGIISDSEVARFPYNEVFWGNTHLHTALSSDAFGAGTRLSTEDAIRIAKGEEIRSNTGQLVKMKRPLDFLAITDHAEGFGVFVEIANGNPILLEDPIAKSWYDMLQGGKEEAAQLAVEIPYALANNKLPEPVTNPEKAIPLLRSSWQAANGIVEKYNDPGKFTTLHAYEWTSVTGGNNLHRNVIFRDGLDKVDSILPFSALQSDDPEKLWDFLANYENKTGGRVLAIPHNGNLSGGEMFGPRKNKEPYDSAYATNRQRWEPLYEIMQIKGVGETHPQLSPNDEFAEYGLVGWDNGNLTLDILITPEQMKTNYARKALMDGLKYESDLGVNPFKFGFVGATDSHTAINTMDEDNWFGKHTTSEPSPERVGEVTKKLNGVTRYGWQYLSGGYTAVWAKSNTREEIWEAMKRRETYATTGTRIKLRFFAGFNFKMEDLQKSDYLKKAYEEGVPMGGDLNGSGVPKFLIHAVKDPNWANLDRVQVIKGWTDKQGNPREKIYDVVWGGNRTLDNQGQLPDVGSTVNLNDGSFDNTIGDQELKTVWEDPDFDPEIKAFYYVRVLEIPTPTWILYDKIKYDLDNVPKDAPLIQQERAWSSPIWYMPNTF